MLPPGFSLLRRWAVWRFSSEQSGVAALVSAATWQQPTIRVYGRECQVPRLTCWYGARAYAYSGVENASQPMPAWLDDMRSSAERECSSLCGGRFNSALLNYYRDGRDSVAYHADDEPELGEHPIIASLSIGAERKFAIKCRATGARTDVMLGHGDLLLMYGRSQVDYLHAVPKTTKQVGGRVNITFRYVH